MAIFKYSLNGVEDYTWWPDLIATSFYQNLNEVDTTSTTSTTSTTYTVTVVGRRRQRHSGRRGRC